MKSAWLAFGALFFLSAPAYAQSNEAAAEALFNEGSALVDAGKIEAGCKKLEASQALDASTGTLLHLADCYERAGRTATAWARFREAAGRAAREGREDFEKIAKTRAAELEPKLAKLRIEAPIGVRVSQDDVDIPPAALGSELPIDPGTHTLRASANGKQPWTQKITVEPARATRVTIPALVDNPAAAAPPPEAPHATESVMRPLGYGLGVVGVVGLGLGAVTGGIAISNNNKAKSACPDPGPCSDSSARDHADSARTAATISTIGIIGGGVLLATGVTLVLLSPSDKTNAALRVSPQAMWLEGTF